MKFLTLISIIASLNAMAIKMQLIRFQAKHQKLIRVSGHCIPGLVSGSHGTCWPDHGGAPHLFTHCSTPCPRSPFYGRRGCLVQPYSKGRTVCGAEMMTNRNTGQAIVILPNREVPRRMRRPYVAYYVARKRDSFHRLFPPEAPPTPESRAAASAAALRSRLPDARRAKTSTRPVKVAERRGGGREG